MLNFGATCIQFMINPNNYLENISKALKFIDQAIIKDHPKLIVFPETITTGFGIAGSIEELYNKIDFVPGILTNAICDKAAKEKIYIVWPTYEKGEEKNIIYNTVLLIDDKGNIAGKYRKTHLFPTERLENGGWVTPGNEVVVVNTPIANIGLICCYDGDFPELSRACVINGAEIIVRPSAFLRTFEIWDLTNKARAYDNQIYVLAANAVGPDAMGNNYFGHSMIVSPIAQTIALARGTEEIIYAELSSEPLKYINYGTRTPMLFNHIEDRNISVYTNLLTQTKSTLPRYHSTQEEVLINILPKN